MPWLRIDDGFDSHPKILALKTDARRFAWMRILIYSCRYSNPVLPDEIQHTISVATTRFLSDCERLGLLDRDDQGRLVIHDWDEYNRASSEDIDTAVSAALSAHPDASANEIVRLVGGKRKLVLDSIRRFRTGTQLVPEGGTRNQEGTGSRVGARGRPVPNPNNRGEERPLGATPPLPQLDQPAESAKRSPASPSNGRAVDPDEWFGGDQKQKRGKPAEVVGDKPKPFKRKTAEAYVRNVAWLDPHPADALRAQYADIPDDDLIELVELAAELARAHDPSTDPVGGAAA